LTRLPHVNGPLERRRIAIGVSPMNVGRSGLFRLALQYNGLPDKALKDSVT
jgi:hypothetical protein